MSEQSKDYQRGYAAGRKRQQVDIGKEIMQAKIDELWNAAFLAALPACISAEGWTMGIDKKPVNTLNRRTQLASLFADEAVKYLRVTVTHAKQHGALIDTHA